MKNFHVCYYKNQNFPLLSGYNIEAETIEIALFLFKQEFPNYEIYYIHNKSTNTREMHPESYWAESRWKPNFWKDAKKN